MNLLHKAAIVAIAYGIFTEGMKIFEAGLAEHPRDRQERKRQERQERERVRLEMTYDRLPDGRYRFNYWKALKNGGKYH